MSLEGRVALVTGASRGIGKAIALVLGQRGAKVAVNYNRNSYGAVCVTSAIEELGSDALSIGADVSNQAQVEHLVARVMEHWGRLDILVNNAGIVRDKLLLRMTTEEWDQVINVNLRGTFLCTRTVLPCMMSNHYGRIVNIASTAGISGNRGQANYAASKAGVIGFTKAVAQEVASLSITVNALAPGYTATDMVTQLPRDVQSEILSRIPMNRLGTPEGVAEAVCFLASDGAGYITGQVLGIDGGLTLSAGLLMN